jgi:MOSC domain-containing protein YiiM
MPRVVAVSVGTPREVQWRGRLVRTSIFKAPVSSRVGVGRENIAGDAQSDLTVHGGLDKAVYAYPAEHYASWRRELPDAELSWAAFGENLTTEGLLEDDVWIGDRYRVGTAELVVTQPRMPCYKLGIRFGRPDMVKRFHESGRNGFYFRVAREGDVAPGDSIERLARDDVRLTVADVVALYVTETPDEGLLRRAIDHPALPAAWRDYFSRPRGAARDS